MIFETGMVIMNREIQKEKKDNNNNDGPILTWTWLQRINHKSRHAYGYKVGSS